MEPRDRESLVDIVTSGERILDRIQGCSLDVFTADIDLQDVVLYRLMLIGEAARRLRSPEELPLDGVAWPDVVSLRNLLIHAYDDIDLRLVWTTITVALPPLVRQIENAITVEDGEKEATESGHPPEDRS